MKRACNLLCFQVVNKIYHESIYKFRQISSLFSPFVLWLRVGRGKEVVKLFKGFSLALSQVKFVVILISTFFWWDQSSFKEWGRSNYHVGFLFFHAWLWAHLIIKAAMSKPRRKHVVQSASAPINLLIQAILSKISLSAQLIALTTKSFRTQSIGSDQTAWF